MSDLTPVRFDRKEIAALAAKHGVDMKNLPTKEERDREAFEKGWANYQWKVRRWYNAMSIWPADQRLKFTFNDWNVELQDDDSAKILGNQAYKLCKKLENEPANVFMLGSRGVGKTSLALAMLDKLSATKTTMFVSTAELANMIDQKYKHTDIEIHLKEVENAMKDVDVLLLDDFGTEGGIKSQALSEVRRDMQRLMYRVANSRFDLNKNAISKSTIITTNNLQSELEQMYNEKTLSRLIPKSKEQRLAFNGMQDVRGV